MANFQKLKNQARREEQRSNWAGAIELYKQAIRLDEDVSRSVDLSLYNRIGDLYLRLDNPSVAVEYYEQTVDLYADQDMHTSAIALCNKILRITPDHTATYRRLGKLHAQTGLLAEARSNYLQYARRTQEAGELGDALEALQEFVDLSSDEGIRRAFAESLVERGLPAEAVAQLRLVWESLTARGSDAEDVRSRILEIDPSADPRDTQAPGPRSGGKTATGPAPSADVIQGIQDAEVLVDEPAAAGEKPEVTLTASESVGPADLPADPDVQVDRDGTVNLARLINEELGDIIRIEEPVDTATDHDTAVTTAAETDLTTEDQAGEVRSSVIDQFRSEIGRIVEESDYSVHYDLGVAYMSMGLIDEAMVEFRAAIQGETYLTAAHEMIGECLRLKAGGDSSEVTGKAVVTEAPDPEALSLEEPVAKPTVEASSAPGLSEEERLADLTAELESEAFIPDVPLLPDSDPGGPFVLEPVAEPESESVLEPFAEPAPEPEPEPVIEPADQPTGIRSNDALASLLFEARLAQYRARKAESQHDTDYQAHLDLGAAYQEMGLIKEALREYRVAVGGSRAIATRVISSLVKIAGDDAFGDDMRLLALELIPDDTRREFVIGQYLEMHDRWLAADKDSAILRERIAAIDPDAVPVLPEHLDISAEQLPELEDILAELGPLDVEPEVTAGIPPIREATDAPEPPFEIVTLDMVPLDDIEAVMALGPDSPGAELAEPAPPAEAPLAEAPQAEASSATVVNSTDSAASESQGERVLKLALDHAQAGDLEQAETELRAALRLFEEDAEYRKALSVVVALLSLDADDVVLHHQKAEYAIMLNDRATLLRSYMDLGATLRRQNAPRSARSVFGRVLEVDPENADALRAIAELDDLELMQERERRGEEAASAPVEQADFDGLVDDLKSQVSDQPDDTDYESHLELGLAFKEMNMVDEAIRELQIAVRGLQDPLSGYEALGEAFITKGQAGIAYRALQKAVQLDGNDERKVGCLYWLGVAAQDLGEPARAREFFERVMTVDIDYRDTAARIADCSL